MRRREYFFHPSSFHIHPYFRETNKFLMQRIPLLTDDFEGDSRPQEGVPDIGFDESPFPPLDYVFLPIVIKE